jgi:multiple sugar transport system permease protein
MTIAKSIRLLLAGISACIVVWAFMTVIARAVRHWSSLQERPIELTILHWGDPAENRIVTDLVDEYQKLNPKVKIIDIHASDMRSKLKTMLAAGTPPDLFYLPPDLLPELAELKLIRAIDDDLKQDFSENGQAWFDDYFPILIDAFRYNSKTHEIGSGPLYGLPKDFTPSVFYINIDLFEKAGIDWKTIQKNGWTTDEFEDVMKKIRALNDLPEFKDRNIYGGVFEIWPDTLRQLLWMFGGEFFGKNADGTINFRDVALDSPASQEALDFIVRLRLKDKTVFNATGIAKDGVQEFVNGNIGCSGPVGRWKVPRFTSDMKFKWDVVPLPFKKGVIPASQVYYTAWTATRESKYPHEAFKLMKFLCGPGGAVQQSRLGLAIPPLTSVAYSPDFLSPPGIPQHDAQLFLDWIKYAKLQQVPREAEWTRIVGDKITDAIQLGEKTTMQSAQEIETTWMNELNSPLRTREWSPMRWDIIGTIAAIVIVILVVLGIVKARKEKLGPIDRAHERTGYAFILPWLIGFLALTAGPMVVSMLLSFTKWSAMTPMGSAEAVGIANYKQLFFKDPTFLQSLKVTGYFVLLSVPVSQVTALLVAMLMNLRIKGIGVFRTVYFVPSVVGMVAMSMLALQVFNNDYGILNQILKPIAGFFGTTPPDWFGLDARVWAIPGFVIIGLWGVGGGMIIYLAGLKGIPISLYEAATIDGAGPLRKFWNVTLPMLSPLIFYNFVMGLIGSFQVFTQAYIMTGAGPGNATLFYVLQLYRQAFEFHNMGYASAMAWVLFVICLILTLIVFRGSKNLVYYEGLK